MGKLTPDEQAEYERSFIDVTDDLGVTHVMRAKPLTPDDLEKYARDLEQQRRDDPAW